jgi:hypothetical protein
MVFDNKSANNLFLGQLSFMEQAVPVPYEVHAVGGWHCLPLSNVILRQINIDATPGIKNFLDF